MQIIYTSQFERKYKKLSEDLKILAEEREKIFRKNPFNKKLDTHKLHGKLKNFWSFSVAHNFRIIFEISKNKKVFYFHSIGNHKIYN
ncbi:type II toxin-antitoxin system mRNA interferase toxin, RelE/StbE family [Patescibacteria group bacterium]|nr:type II toxin-antitoxin system mRNA interferase toxin, RelE/StbE family [Patescibacteria group bacterium]MBU1519323.1 type II toxin-antitoxin system mRNA interferase toxin, RelE/StbE family [Patescibacteria group bacterium]